jgi:hypothetical protein
MDLLRSLLANYLKSVHKKFTNTCDTKGHQSEPSQEQLLHYYYSQK